MYSNIYKIAIALNEQNPTKHVISRETVTKRTTPFASVTLDQFKLNVFSFGLFLHSKRSKNTSL